MQDPTQRPNDSDAATSTTSTPTPADVVAAAATKRGLPSLVQKMLDNIQMSRLMQAMRLQSRPAKPKPASGLWPVDARGQYISDRRDSHGNLVTKRSRHVKAVQ